MFYVLCFMCDKEKDENMNKVMTIRDTGRCMADTGLSDKACSSASFHPGVADIDKEWVILFQFQRQ